jgi:site-specific recombinase XerD
VRPSSLAALAGRLTHSRLGALADQPLSGVTSEKVQEWQTSLLHRERPLSPSTVADTRTTLRQLFDCAVDHDLIRKNPVAQVRPPKVDKRVGRCLSPDEAKRLVQACASGRYGLVVAMLFAQGWRVSEVLGLAWQDVNLDAGTATVERAVIQAAGATRTLGPPKSAGAQGTHVLTPGVVARLRQHLAAQLDEGHGTLPSRTYGSRSINLVFTTADGGLVARQAIDKLMRDKAAELGIDAQRLGTHVGRRTVVTALYTAGEDLEDIARHVGHRSTVTTAGYVAALGNRPKATADRAAALLDVSIE